MEHTIKAVVLAAGKGTRLRTEGVDLPKVLRQAAGRPLLAYVLGEYVLSDPAIADGTANTMAFATLVFCELTRAFAVRSERRSIFQIGLLSNKTMNKAFAISLALQLGVLLIPALQPIFSITPLTALEWVVVVLLALVPLVISELVKLVLRIRDRAREGQTQD